MARWSVLGARSIRRRRGRFTLTVVGVALGIAVLFSVLITNATIDEGFSRIFGRAELPSAQIQPAGGYASEVPASVVDAAAKLDDVIDVNGSSGVDFRKPDGKPEESLTIWGGVYRKGEATAPKRRQRGDDILERGREPAAGAMEIGLRDGTARELRARIGSTVKLVGPSGPVEFKVVSVTYRRDGKPTDDFGGWTSLETNTRIAGRGEVINYAYIRLAKGTDSSRWVAEHTGQLGPNVQLITGDIGADAFKEVLRSGKAALAGLAGVALFVSAFLIFLTLSMTVAEAAPIHGTLRAVGASKAQVRRTVLGDALVLVAAAIPGGLLLGLAAATGVIQVTRGAYNLPHLPMQVPPGAAIEAAIVGVVVTLAAALVPAQRAASVVPVAAIRSGSEERVGVGRMWVLGTLSVAAGLAIVFLLDQRRVDAGSILILFGAVVLVPAVMGPIAAGAGRVTRRLARGVGAVGVLHLRKEPRRSAYTLALVMVVLAMVFTSGAVHLSLRRNLNETIEQRFPADLAVFAGANLKDEVQQKVLSTSGVQSGAGVWFTSGAMQTPLASRVYITAFDPRKFFAIQGLSWTDGNDADVREAMARGGSLALPDWVTVDRKVRLGDLVTLATPRGPRRYTVAGVYRSQALAPLLLNIEDGRRDFGLTAPTLLAVKVDRDRDPAGVKAAIERSFTGAPVFVQLTSDQRGGFARGQTQFFNLVYALVLIALVMGMLGVTNTLAMAVLRRTREIGILRAVGTERGALRRMALVEATTIAFAGMVLALPLGLLLSFTVLQTTARSLGIVVKYVYPWPMFGVVAVVALVVAAVSSVVPGRHAARVDPARVLRFD